MFPNIFLQLFLIVILSNFVELKVLAPEELKDLVNDGRYPGFGGGYHRPCPLCDSSVYSYCSDKLFHDSCCCSSPYGKVDDHLPYQCQLADCSFLHANSCYEHRLITKCCCTNHILY